MTGAAPTVRRGLINMVARRTGQLYAGAQRTVEKMLGDVEVDDGEVDDGER